MSVLTLIADKIVPFDLTLIVYKLVSMLIFTADKILSIGWALIVHEIVSGF